MDLGDGRSARAAGGTRLRSRIRRWRSEGDSNPRYLLGTHDFQSCTFDHSVIAPWVIARRPGTPKALLPLLPSGPGGVCNVSATGAELSQNSKDTPRAGRRPHLPVLSNTAARAQPASRNRAPASSDPEMGERIAPTTSRR